MEEAVTLRWRPSTNQGGCYEGRQVTIDSSTTYVWSTERYAYQIRFNNNVSLVSRIPSQLTALNQEPSPSHAGTLKLHDRVGFSAFSTTPSTPSR